MKIKRSELPESVAAALAPRTFAQERPEDGQEIEIYVSDVWERGAYSSKHPGTVGMHWIAPADRLWRPILELEDDAPEPERELPEPKPGEFFEADGRLSVCNHQTNPSLKAWKYAADEQGRHADFPWKSFAALPVTWQPLSELIEQAARAKELEVKTQALMSEVEQLETDLVHLNSEYKAIDQMLTEKDARVEELEATLARLNA